MLNKTIRTYTIKRPLGEGGMAEVWYAENERGVPVAYKFLKERFCRDDIVVERFTDEAMVMLRMNHPNIRRVYEYMIVEDRPCIAMEYLEGDDLKTRLQKGEHFSNDRLQKWWDQLADALNYIHKRGVIHRDIKPSNIFIDKRDNVKLMDFGIAKVRRYGGHTQTGMSMGTRIYMSPEQVRDPKRVSAATDSYSLAVTFVHLLTGKVPYDTTNSSDFDIQTAIVNEPLDLGALPPDWHDFLQPYLAKKPEERPELQMFYTKTKIRYDVDDDMYVESVAPPKSKVSPKPVESPKDSQPEEDFPETKSRKWLPWVIGGVVAAVIVAVVLGVMMNKPNIIERSNGDYLIIIKNVNYMMKKVEGGTFQMGATKEQARDANDDEKPVHPVTVSDFRMGETEVTQALWKAVMGNNPSHFKGDDLPVENVSWDDCQEFIRKLNQMTDKTFRLPTEAEWEYAARGGNKSRGYKYAGSNTIDNVAWYSNSGSATHRVRGKRANELGLYDMSGNVREWCSDWYGGYSSSSQTNPAGPAKGSRRVTRGGRWGSDAKNCRVSDRNRRTHDYRGNNLGFRLVCQ